MPRPLQTNAADPRQVRYAGRKEHRTEDTFDAALAAVLGTFEGRLVIDTWLQKAGLYEGGFVEAPESLYFREGRRAFGLELLDAVIRVSPEHWQLMNRERQVRVARDDRESEAVQAATTQPEEPETDG